MEEYSADQSFPVYGFGAQLDEKSKQKDENSYCFALNGDIFNPNVTRVKGILAAYNNSINKVKLGSFNNLSLVLN